MKRSLSGLFENKGLGWTCVSCGSGSTAGEAPAQSLFSRGEAEGPAERTISAMARWANEEKSALECGRCRQTDLIGGTGRDGQDGVSD